MKRIILLAFFSIVLGRLSVAQVGVINADSVRVGNQGGTGSNSLYGKTYLKNITLGSAHDSVLVRSASGVIKYVPRSLFGVSGSDSVVAVSTLRNIGTPAADLTTIEAWGDSFTEAAGFTPYTSTLAALSGLTVNNNGQGGETSTQIKTRLLAASSGKKARPTIIWAGFNDYPNMNTAITNIADMVAALGHDSYMIVGATMSANGGFETGLAGWIAKKKFNDSLALIYRQHFFDAHSFIMSRYNPASVSDLQNVIDDVEPASLRSDLTHLTSQGYALVGAEIFNRIKMLDIGSTALSQNVLTDMLLSPLHLGEVKRAPAYVSYLEANNINISKDGMIRQDGLPVFRSFRNSLYLGYESGKAVRSNTGTSSVYNTMLGYQAGLQATGGVNTLLGFQAAANLTTGGNNIAIGNGVDLPSPTGFNQLNIGNIIYGTGITGTGTTVAGRIGIGTSSPGLSSMLEVNGLANYTSDVSASYTDRSFIDKAYADSRYMPFSAGAFAGDFIVDGTDGRHFGFKTGGNYTTITGNSHSVFGSGSTTDFNTYIFGNNAYNVYTNGYKRLQIEGGTSPGTGIGTFYGAFSASSFTGPLTGNVTGDVTGNVTGSAGSVPWTGVTNRPGNLSDFANDLNLGSNAYTSTAYLPAAGGTLTGDLFLDGTSGQRLTLKTGGTNTAILGNSNSVFSSGSTSDLNMYVFGTNPYNIYTNNLKRLEISGAGVSTFSAPVKTPELEITDGANGLILKSPNGTRYKITIDNSGVLSATSL